MTDIWEICIRLGLAILIGFVVGLERERRHRPAGIKTHILVCMGATIISLIQVEMIQDVILQVAKNPELGNILKADYGRLGAQVISGIGFLGAGTIMRTRGSIKGLTTAATLWLVACVGLGIGMGYYAISIISITLVMAIITLLKYFQKGLQSKSGIQILDLHFVNKKETMLLLHDYFSEKNIQVRNIEFSDEQENLHVNGKPLIQCSYSIALPKGSDLQKVINDLGMEDNIMQIGENAE
jgi:putative Mg2+ transporter-C (MgtC) family protein